MATRMQIEANRRNAVLGGPKTDDGKAVSRLNARTHGIFAAALTEQDHAELYGLYEELAETIQPRGGIEEMLLEKLAQTYLRLQRCARAEAVHHVGTWKPDYVPPARKGSERPVEAPMQDRYFHAKHFEAAVNLFSRYDKTLTGQFVQLLHELERLQRMRRGEAVAAPAVGHVTVDLDAVAAQTAAPLECAPDPDA